MHNNKEKMNKENESNSLNMTPYQLAWSNSFASFIVLCQVTLKYQRFVCLQKGGKRVRENISKNKPFTCIQEMQASLSLFLSLLLSFLWFLLALNYASLSLVFLTCLRPTIYNVNSTLFNLNMIVRYIRLCWTK